MCFVLGLVAFTLGMLLLDKHYEMKEREEWFERYRADRVKKLQKAGQVVHENEESGK